MSVFTDEQIEEMMLAGCDEEDIQSLVDGVKKICESSIKSQDYIAEWAYGSVMQFGPVEVKKNSLGECVAVVK